MSYEDYLAATWLRTRQHWIRGAALKFILRCALLSAVAILVLRFFEGGLSTPESLEIAMFSTVGAIGFFLFIMLLNLWYVPHTCRRLFDQQPAASNPYEFTFNAEGLKTVGRFESNDLPWSHILGWLENDRLIILSKANVTFFCLPKAQLGQTNLSALKQCLSAAGVKKGL